MAKRLDFDFAGRLKRTAVRKRYFERDRDTGRGPNRRLAV
jgi:hypothetical protein